MPRPPSSWTPPVGWLLLVAGDAKRARALLADALATLEREAGDRDAAFPVERAWSWLAEAEWLAGDVDAALGAYVRACLRGGALTEPEMTCEAILDLFDLAADLELPAPITDWIPVIADLLGVARLPDEAFDVPAGAVPARQLARELALYRRARSRPPHDEAARIEAKRTMMKLAPPLVRELLRKI